MVHTDRKYTREHDWVLIEDGVATLGITDHAQSELGDIVYVELPEVDSEINLGESYTTVESVKAASPVNSPVAGTVIEVNEELDAQPELLNEDAFGQFIAKIKVTEIDDRGRVNLSRKDALKEREAMGLKD